jgi:hypothetical protein
MHMTQDSTVNQSLRQTIVMVRWALIIACAYLILFSDNKAAAPGLGLVVIAVFLASNLAIGRLPEEQLRTRGFKVGVAALDTLLIANSLYFAQQLSPEVLLLFLAVVVLAAVGLKLAVIARLTLALAIADVLLTWLTGNQLAWRSSMLLRVPFLLSAALVYGALVEAGLGTAGGSRHVPLVAFDTLSEALASQRDAIQRCEAALSNGGGGTASNALQEIASRNQQMQTTMAHL